MKGKLASGGLVATSSCHCQMCATQISHGQSACRMYTAGPEMPRWPPELLTQRILRKSFSSSALLSGHTAHWLHSSVTHYYYYYYYYHYYITIIITTITIIIVVVRLQLIDPPSATFFLKIHHEWMNSCADSDYSSEKMMKQNKMIRNIHTDE